MKVETGGKIGKTGQAKKSGKAERSDKVFHVSNPFSDGADSLDDIEGAGSADGVDESAALQASSGVSSLLALQEIQLGQEEDKRAYQYGNQLLQQLQQLQAELLRGGVTPDRLQAIARFIQSQRDHVAQSLVLQEIIVQIETRVHVEAAKYGQSLSDIAGRQEY